MTSEPPIDALLGFGFTETEARIYCFLLEESPATGYRISHAIGKAAANTYKALAVLEQKGAIVVESGENRLCRATPPDELLAALSQTFDAKRARAKKALASLHTQSVDHRVYQLTTVEQVFSRAHAMLESATDVAVFDIMPEPAQRVGDHVQAAISRGVDIAAVLYAPDEAFSTETCIVTPWANRVRAVWPGQQINLVVDARETLLAFLSRDCARVIQAVWTNSAYLSVLHYNHLTTEVIGLKYRELAPGLEKQVQAFEKLSLTKSRPPGLEQLLNAAAISIQDNT